MQSYLKVIDLMSRAFTEYLKAKQLSYTVTVMPPAKLENVNQQVNNVLLIYKLNRRQQGSQKMPFQERTFLRPIPVNLEMSVGGMSQEQQFKFFIDNMIQFELYQTDYLLVQKQTEDFIDYMSMLNVTTNVFTQNGYKIPVFWEQLADDVVDLGNTRLYKASLLYQVQTEQTIMQQIDVIRKINLFVETNS